MSLQRLGRLLRYSLVGGAGTAGLVWATTERDRTTELKFQLFSAISSVFQLIDAETAHSLAVWSLAHGLAPRETEPDAKELAVKLWGRTFPNPVGMAAGLDKDAECPRALLEMGFGFVEVGTVTPLPQPGNDRPRMFRLKEHGAVINRYGFNSRGADYAVASLSRFRSEQVAGKVRSAGLVAVNIGKNKTAEDAVADYCVGVQRLGGLADAIVVNISSPNTPGLRSLQGRKELEGLVRRVRAARDAMAWGEQGPPPLLVKIAPDLSREDQEDIAAVVSRASVDGLVVSNTTVTRPESIRSHPAAQEAGGLSGRPLFGMSTQLLANMYRLTDGKVPIIGVGGIADGYDAYKKIRAGASLVEVYTMFAYEGPILVRKIKRQMLECLRKDGFLSLQEAVGADHAVKK